MNLSAKELTSLVLMDLILKYGLLMMEDMDQMTSVSLVNKMNLLEESKTQNALMEKILKGKF
jgi:hypothetical protein